MQNEVKNRSIEYLWHFTKVENIDSILTNGLIPRGTLEQQGTNVAYNDQNRFDDEKGANCLSLGHPNYKMFYSLRCQNTAQQWVVLGIKPEILWIKDCAFCYENAASLNVTSIPIEQRKGLQAFQHLFTAAAGKPDRASLKLPDDCPTNPQAEILAFSVIEPQYIIGAITPNKDLETQFKTQYPNFEFIYHRAFYYARLDYEHW
jgi:hypothetical protein